MKTLKELASDIAGEAKITKADAEKILKAAFSNISTTVASGEEVRIHNFGTFKRKDAPERKGRNPITGEAIVVPAKSSLVFKATKSSKN